MSDVYKYLQNTCIHIYHTRTTYNSILLSQPTNSTNVFLFRAQKSIQQSNLEPAAAQDDNIRSMLEELKEIISKRAEKNVSEIHFKRTSLSDKNVSEIQSKRNNLAGKKPRRKKKKNGLTLHPRGGAPSARFNVSPPPTSDVVPKLEFGFKPLTTQAIVTQTTATPVSLQFDYHDADQVPGVNPLKQISAKLH